MNTCQQCTFWAPEAPIAKAKENMGECNKLSEPTTTIKEEYLLPVLDGKDLDKSNGTEILTAASFGCNQFAEA